MAAWRRRALAAIPELRNELNDANEIFSIYELWFRLLPMASEAYERGDERAVERILDFALWCFAQRSKDLWNSVAVAFFEHLPDSVGEQHVGDVLRRLPDHVIRDVWSLWEWAIPAPRLALIRRELKAQRRPVPA